MSTKDFSLPNNRPVEKLVFTDDRYLSQSENSDFDSPRYSSQDSNYFSQSQSQNSTRPGQGYSSMSKQNYPQDMRFMSQTQNNPFKHQRSNSARQHTSKSFSDRDRVTINENEFVVYKNDKYRNTRQGERSQSPDGLAEQVRSLSPIPMRLDFGELQGEAMQHRQFCEYPGEQKLMQFQHNRNASDNSDRHHSTRRGSHQSDNGEKLFSTRRGSHQSHNGSDTVKDNAHKSKTCDRQNDDEDIKFCTPPLQRTDGSQSTPRTGTDSNNKELSEANNQTPVSRQVKVKHSLRQEQSSDLDSGDQFTELQQESLETNDQGPTSGSPFKEQRVSFEDSPNKDHKVSFEERLSTFLDDEHDIDVEELLRKDRERTQTVN